MLQIPILDVIIATVFIFFLFSLLATLIVEIIANAQQIRGKMLMEGLAKVVAAKNWLSKLLEHPIIQNLCKEGQKIPAYISAQVFSSALIDLLAEKADATLPTVQSYTDTFTKIKQGIANLKNDADEGKLKVWFQAFLNNATTLEEFKSNIQDWYNEYMDKLSAWYKLDVSKLLFWVAIPIVVAFNVDAIKIAQSLIHDDTLRNNIIAQAIQPIDEKYKSNMRLKDTLKNTKNEQDDAVVMKNITDKVALASNVYQNIKAQSLPIGWNISWHQLGESNMSWGAMLYYGIFTLIGWIISVFAIQRGAPFWFDMLKNLVNIRSAGKKPTS